MTSVAPAPYLEDRWDEEITSETLMLEAGRRRAEERIAKAKRKGQLEQLRPHRTLVKSMIDDVAKDLEEWLDTTSTRRGVKPICLEPLKLLPPETAALVALTSIFRKVGIKHRTVTAIAQEIGTRIEHEARCLAWADQDPDSWNKLTAIYAARGSDSAHQRRSRTAIFNRHILDKIDFEPWNKEMRRRVGLQMLDCVIRATGRFYITQEVDKSTILYDRKKGSKAAAAKFALVLVPDAQMMRWIDNALADELVYWPVYMPTKIPPKPWTGPRDGGYWTPFVPTPFLIRFRASHETQHQKAIEEYEALDMPEVYEGLNFIQDTRWKINKPVLEVMQQFWDNDTALAGIPRRSAEMVPQRPDNYEEDPEAYKEWAREAGKINTENAKRISRYLSAKNVIHAGDILKDDPGFYFPHMLDFRSRMYPIPSEISPQGNDMHRGLLTFADAKPVDEEGAKWLAIEVASRFGIDKTSMNDRLDWVHERRDLWRAIADDPTGNRQWAEQKDAWQALAAVLELDGYMREGNGFMSSLPVKVDGSCNGIQHLSAMVRDEVGGAAVNLTEGDQPRDIYQEVADVLWEKMLTKRDDPYIAQWVSGLGPEGAPRSLTKRPVMILPYGGTKMAYMKYIRKWLVEEDGHEGIFRADQRAHASGALMKVLWPVVEEKCRRAKSVMKWLQDVASVAASSGLPIYWRTPAGFVVRHFYGTMATSRVETMIDGQRIQLRVWDATTKLDHKAQSKGIAPNFTHSLDASSLLSTAVMAKDNGITHMTAIHDAYGTHASDMWTLYSCIREGFIRTHQEPVLEQFLAAAKEVRPDVENWPKLPEFGTLDIEEVRYSDYFFA